MSINLRRKVASECAPALDHFDPTPLTVSDLRGAKLGAAHFAYLSACSAAQDVCSARSEEASHLLDSFVRFTKPMPPWSRLPDNLEFRWLYVEFLFSDIAFL